MANFVNPNRVYEDYDPPSDLVSEYECDTILVYLPGYRKEQLRVQLTASRILKISGERHVSDNKYRRFHKEFQVPNNCDTKEITAKFEGGIVYIRQPKMVTPAAPAGAPEQLADKAKPSAEAPPPMPPRQPQPQPQPQPREQPQPKPQLQSHDLPRPRPQPQPQPQPLPQPQQQAPLSEPQKGVEEKPEKKGHVDDAISKEEQGKALKNGEEEKEQCKYTPRPRQMVGRGGLFSELRKPENLKRLVVTLILVLGIGFYTSYLFKSIMGDDKDL